MVDCLSLGLSSCFSIIATSCRHGNIGPVLLFYCDDATLLPVFVPLYRKYVGNAEMVQFQDACLMLRFVCLHWQLCCYATRPYQIWGITFKISTENLTNIERRRSLPWTRCRGRASVDSNRRGDMFYFAFVSHHFTEESENKCIEYKV